jgi:hypothetical protein
MSKNFIANHRFDRNQHVSFAGGEGVIKGFKFEHGNWKYAIEMPQGVEPQFGRIGPPSASTIFLTIARPMPVLSDQFWGLTA